MEDLDSLLNPQNRSYFLNELDGFAANVGINTPATTNHRAAGPSHSLIAPAVLIANIPLNSSRVGESVKPKHRHVE